MKAVSLALRPVTGALLLLAAVLAVAEVPVPALQARVTDLTGTLSPPQQGRLEQALAAFEARKGSQIAVLIVPTTRPETIEQYALRVAEAWKLGREGIDDGVLLLVAKEDRALRLEVGYGLEGVIPDAVAKRVISEIIIPYFKQNDYFGGIEAGVNRLIRLTDGEPLPPPVEKDVSWSGFEDFLPLGFLLVLVGAGLFRMIFGRLLGASIVGGLVGVLFWFIIGSLIGALIAGFIAFLFSLGGMRSTGVWPGGGGFGGGFGRGGGFSGGGGRFGGGGASGHWRIAWAAPLITGRE